jgi:hypothetical protein
MRTRTWLFGIAVALGGWYALRDDPAPRPAAAPQLAVAGRGFALHDPATRHARLLDLDGKARREITLRDLPGDARVFAESGGLAALWRERGRIQTARVGLNGERGKVSSWGTRPVGLCDGVASNANRFSLGWLEQDGSVWFVFGPTSGNRENEAQHVTAAATVTATATAGPKTTWCTLAVSGDLTVLMWRRGEQLYLSACGKKCPGFPPSVRGELGRRAPLGFGCAGKGCGIASRDGRGATHLTWVNHGGSTAWDRVLPDHRGEAVEVIGAGDRQLAVAYEDSRGQLVVARVSIAGELVTLWRDGDGGQAPSLSWVDGVLALAYQRGGRVVTTTIPLPR